MICFCDCCHYTFSAASLPDRCPDCGKQIHNGVPAVRAATAKEIADYERIRQELIKEKAETTGTFEALEASKASKISEASDISGISRGEQP